MTFEDYYRDNVTYISRVDPRLAKIIELTTQRKPSSTLDIGCGRGFLLGHLAQRGLSGLAGLDVYDDVSDPRFDYIRADVTQPFPIADASYELVIAGEIIEHVPNPDDFLREIRRVVTPGGTVIISTPNLVSWANRVLVPFGVQPLGTETSSEIALGRRHRILGQGNQVQGHLKVFTHRALAEIMQRYGFEITHRLGVPAFFPKPVDRFDRLMAKRVAFASGLVYVATAPTGPWPTPVAGRRHEDCESP
ncbi:MAG: class I SAM-dependent methyltransferase [Nostocoides sp.]|uniref:class I SAM-dependent methyltransferase n=1 Tax=Nostocoides sp. TaxID=1917966 RepID=UPI002CC228AC|nr:class I SAM-dependent methyltransferase [Tetrasphaera sp.]